MISPLMGTLVLLATLLGVGLGLGIWLIGRLREQRGWSRLGGVLAGGVVGAYGLLWLTTVPLGRERPMAPGAEVAFCGVDCHLHVSVARVHRGNSLAVVVRLRSDAKRAEEYPGFLRFEVVGVDGRRWTPADGMIAETLPPGGELEREFQFAVGREVAVRGLAVSRPGWIDYLLPGQGNPWVQRRKVLSLAGA
ncbi:MAG: hypothetical protein ACKVZ0_08895 [Gemmatimonadales bacterium]